VEHDTSWRCSPNNGCTRPGAAGDFRVRSNIPSCSTIARHKERFLAVYIVFILASKPLKNLYVFLFYETTSFHFCRCNVGTCKLVVTVTLVQIRSTTRSVLEFYLKVIKIGIVLALQRFSCYFSLLYDGNGFIFRS